MSDLAGYQYMIRHAPRLSSLMLRGTSLVHNKSGTVPQDFDEQGYLLTTSLLSRLRGDETRSLNLVEVLLEELNLESAYDTLAALINFAQLQWLELSLCKGSEELLSRLAANFHSGTSNLTRFVADFKEVNPQILEGFLRSWTGLNTLRITEKPPPHSTMDACPVMRRLSRHLRYRWEHQEVKRRKVCLFPAHFLLFCQRSALLFNSLESHFPRSRCCTKAPTKWGLLVERPNLCSASPSSRYCASSLGRSQTTSSSPDSRIRDCKSNTTAKPTFRDSTNSLRS